MIFLILIININNLDNQFIVPLPEGFEKDMSEISEKLEVVEKDDEYEDFGDGVGFSGFIKKKNVIY